MTRILLLAPLCGMLLAENAMALTLTDCQNHICTSTGNPQWALAQKHESTTCAPGIEGLYPYSSRPVLNASGKCACLLSTATEYRCADGYTGSPTNCREGCTAQCPENSTYNGENCICNIGYYRDSDKCTPCPNGGTTAMPGAVFITSCYIPANTGFNDAYGSGTYTSNCYYTN